MKKAWLAAPVLLSALLFSALNAEDFDLNSLRAKDVRGQAAPSAPVQPPRGKKTRAGFATGLNYPWLNYGTDFGRSAWGYTGIAAPDRRAAAAADFADMRARDVKIVRWFIMADCQSSPEFDGQGLVTGFDDKFYADFDAALDLAEANGMQLIPVLFNFSMSDPAKQLNGVQIAGHANLVRDPRATESLLNNALVPLFKKYGHRQCIYAWEIMNEPELRMKSFLGVGTAIVSYSEMYNFAKKVTDAVHANAAQPVTMGSYRRTEMAQWKGVGLDLYQFHYYDYMSWTMGSLDVKYSDLGLDKPCLLGEFPTRQKNLSIENYMDITLRDGYAGALAWSYRAQDDYSDFKSMAGRYYNWVHYH